MSVDSIKQENIKFIENLKGDESIGIDEKGRLYQIKESKISSFVKGVFKKQDPKVSRVVTETVTEILLSENIKETTNSQKMYQNLLNKIVASNAVSSNQKNSLSMLWYSNKLNNLVSQGIEREVAEAMVTVEMCHDPYVSESIISMILPEPTKGGTSGSYFIKNMDGIKIGIFKPQDEEIYMPNNPKGYTAPLSDRRLGPRNGHLQGTSWLKEQAAWLLDKEAHSKIATSVSPIATSVPYTTATILPFVENSHSTNIVQKKGSFQQFAKGEPVENLTDEEIQSIPIKQVHKVALFDLKVGNADRNLGNILYDKKSKILTPIDHGLILLDSLDWKGSNTVSETNCHWMSWPHAKEPISQEDKDFILNRDIDEECKTLRESGISEGSIREFRLRAIFLKEAVNQDLTLYEIGLLCMQTSGNADVSTFLDNAMRSTTFSLIDNDQFEDETIFYATFTQIIHDIKQKKSLK